MLYGRDVERSAIAALLADARAGRSGALVLRGEPGVGKSALLVDAIARADGMRVLHVVGVQTESEIAFAALHQLARPLLEHLDAIPAPQAQALREALGLAPATEPDRFLISVALLSLLASGAETEPLLCVVDDAQWLDEPSAGALAFVARRLGAEGIGLVIAARDGGARRFDAAGLRELRVAGLDRDAAEALLSERVGLRLPPAVRDRLCEATGGNPLAMLELPRLLTEDQLTGREPLSGPAPIGAAIEEAFLERARELPAACRTLLLIAAADDTGDPAVLLRGARRLGIDPSAFGAAEAAGLARFGTPAVEFRHPLVRSAVYHGASLPERQQVHRLLAGILGDEHDADRRAWHRAAAAVGPEDAIADELERTADRARRRSGYAAAAAAFERAAALTQDDDRRALRLVAAAHAGSLAGRPDHAAALLEQARGLASSASLLADIDHVHGTIEFGRGEPGVAHRILLTGSATAAAVDPPKALRMLVAAGEAAGFAGDFSLEIEAGRRAEELGRQAGEDGFEHAWLVGVGSLLAGDFAKGVPLLRQAVAAAEGSGDPRRLASAGEAAVYLGDLDAALAVWGRAVASARALGAVGTLPLLLALVAAIEVIAGRLSAAGANAAEGLRLATETGQQNSACYHLAILARVEALTGRADECRAHADEALSTATANGLHFQAATASWALGHVALALGRAAEALSRFEALAHVAPGASHPIIAIYTTPDLVEAARRAEEPGAATASVARFEEWAQAVASPWALALLARCRAALAAGPAARDAFEHALALHAADGRQFDIARTELLYGEVLRRGRERAQARAHLRTALDLFERVGATPWAERARAELRATGETARKRDPSTIDQLTRQELQVARFVAEGLSNRQVAEQLFLSPRTIDFHLRNVFRKLDIASRNELARLRLEDDPSATEPVGTAAS